MINQIVKNLIIRATPSFYWCSFLSHPDSWSDPLRDPNRVRGARPYTGTFFLSRIYTCGYGPHLITESKYHIHIKRTTTGVASIKIYIHILSLIHLYKNYIFNIYKSEHGTYCDEPLLVCWPSCMRMFSDVFSCTYTD